MYSSSESEEPDPEEPDPEEPDPEEPDPEEPDPEEPEPEEPEEPEEPDDESRLSIAIADALVAILPSYSLWSGLFMFNLEGVEDCRRSCLFSTGISGV